MSTMKHSQYDIGFGHCLDIRIKNHSFSHIFKYTTVYEVS